MKSSALQRARKQKKKALKLLERHKELEALPLLQDVCQLTPNDGEAWQILGAIHGHQGNIQAAIYCSEQAVTTMPTSIQALDNLALGYHQIGEIDKACSTLKRRLALDPNHRDTVLRLAQNLMSIEKTDETRNIYLKYLTTHPNDYEILTNIGITFELEGSLQQAEYYYRQALDLNPSLSTTLQNLANVLSAQGKIDAALDTYLTALKHDPGNTIARSNYLLNLHYKTDASAKEIYTTHKEQMRTTGTVKNKPVFNYLIEPARKLNIGFVSPDIRTHSVAYFIEALLTSINNRKYGIFCYADVAKHDKTTARIKDLSHNWRDISGTDITKICNLIQNDKIDILIDLAGHTSPRNIAIFARRPSPIQVTWLGYPNTTGLHCMDYRITDTFADPVEDSPPYTEELIRLDGCFLCYKPAVDSPEVSKLPAIDNSFVTFGSFNNLAKINTNVLDLWAKLLNRVNNARLYLKNPSFTDKTTRDACLEKLITLGISPDRIILTGRTQTLDEHLQLYSNIDIALDTFPYNGTTTTCEALWMGVPVVTMSGYLHAGRVGVSLLNAVNHTEWIGQNKEDYLAIAAKLASNINTLGRIRSNLRHAMKNSLLCDSEQFATRFTDALRAIWTKYCASSTR